MDSVVLNKFKIMYVVKYIGKFGFIKPFNAVRDSKILTQKFLNESTITGIEKTLECENNIIRHKISYDNISWQQECTESSGYDKKYLKNKSILTRGVMVNPKLYLGFENKNDAEKAYNNIILLCRREDLMYPIELFESNESNFDNIVGTESFKSDNENGFFVGFNKFTKERMFTSIKVVDPQ